MRIFINSAFFVALFWSCLIFNCLFLVCDSLWVDLFDGYFLLLIFNFNICYDNLMILFGY